MKSLYIDGMKSFFKQQKIELSDITIFAGANSSGKSTAAQALLLLKQTIESQYEPGAMLIDGANVKFTSVDQIMSKRPGQAAKSSFTIGIENKDNSSIFSTYGRKVGPGIEIKNSTLTLANGRSLSFKIGKKITQEETNFLLDSISERSGLSSLIKNKKISARWEARQARCFNDLVLFGEIGTGDNTISTLELDKISLQGKIKKVISDLIHIQGLRGNPERTYPANARGIQNFKGLFTDYVASVLQQWQDEKSSKLDELGNDLRELGLSWKIRAQRVHDTQVEIRVGRLLSSAQGGAHDLVNLADVGIGVSQVLPFLVALHEAKKGQIVFVEQPEIHLHPRAQYRLVDAILNATNRGVLVWLETHSSAILRGFQTKVAKGDLEPEKIALNWFSRDLITGATVVTAAHPNKNGQYGEWPVDFDETNLLVEKNYLDAVAKNIF